jgi:hypothetical protein
MAPQFLTAREAATRLRVHRTTVNMWNSKGWLDAEGQRHYLEVKGTASNGARLFDWGQLLTAEQQTRSKSQRSHRASRRLATI